MPACQAPSGTVIATDSVATNADSAVVAVVPYQASSGRESRGEARELARGESQEELSGPPVLAHRLNATTSCGRTRPCSGWAILIVTEARTGGRIMSEHEGQNDGAPNGNVRKATRLERRLSALEGGPRQPEPISVLRLLNTEELRLALTLIERAGYCPMATYATRKPSERPRRKNWRLWSTGGSCTASRSTIWNWQRSCWIVWARLAAGAHPSPTRPP